MQLLLPSYYTLYSNRIIRCSPLSPTTLYLEYKTEPIQRFFWQRDQIKSPRAQPTLKSTCCISGFVSTPRLSNHFARLTTKNSKATVGAPLVSLPAEILLIILSNLRLLEDLLSMILTCRRIAAVFEGSQRQVIESIFFKICSSQSKRRYVWNSLQFPSLQR